MSIAIDTLRKQASRLAASESARGAALSLSLKLAASALNILMLTLVARSMSADVFGVFALWFNALSFLAVVAGCGQEKLILRSWNEYVESGRYGTALGALRFGTSVSLVGAVVLSALVIAAGWLWGTPGALLATACVFLVVQTLYLFTTHVNRAVVGIVGADGHDVTWRVVVIASVAVALLSGWRLEVASFFVLASVGMGIALVLQALTARRSMPETVRNATPRMELRVWSARSLKMASAGILEAANQYLEVVLVGIVLSPAAAGGYFVAARLANAFSMITGGLNTFSTREISRQHYGEGSEAVVNTLRNLGIITSVLVAVGGLVVVAAGPRILSIFGSGFVDQYPILLLLSLGTAFVALSGPAPAVLLLTGHEGVYSLIVAASVAVRCLVITILAWWFGALGAAAASAGCSILAAIALNIACRRLVAVDPAITLLLPSARASS